MLSDDKSLFFHAPSPDHPGWHTWDLADSTRFNGQALGNLLVRPDGDGKARLRMFAEHRHSNLHDKVHGGCTLALVDVAMFAGASVVLGGDMIGAVTLDLSCQFVGSGNLREPLDTVVEVLKETGRLVFVRGLVEQGDHLVAAFSGTLRKQSRR